jgi:serine phosphatase RsbU (regulator of sigma subunit)
MMDVSSAYRPEGHCGGDWWTIRKLDDERVLMAIADVTGHGAAAAMVTGVVDATCRELDSSSGAGEVCTGLLDRMNRSMRATLGGSVMATCFAAVIDCRSRRVTVANAGHRFPYLIRDCAGDNELQTIVARGNALGASDDSAYAAVEYELDRGDAILWCTDGVTECVDGAGREFGDKRLQRVIRSVDLAGGAVAARDEVLTAIGHFCGSSAINDDLTLVVTRLD